MTNGNYNRRGFLELLAKGSVAAGIGAVGLAEAGCMPTEAKAGGTPPTNPEPSSKSPDAINTPEASEVPTIEQFAGLSPEEVTQFVQEYLGKAKNPSEYTQLRMNLMNLVMQAGSTETEVNEHFIGAGKNAGTFSAYVNEKYIVPLYRGVETAGQPNEAAAITWYKAFFSAPTLRYAIGQALGGTVPYEAKATLDETSVTNGDTTSSATPFTVKFGFKVTDNFVESKVSTMQPSSEKPLDSSYTFTSNIVPTKKDGKTILSSVGTAMTKY